MITTLDKTTPGFIGRIPVRNIWLLLLYASQLYRELPEARRVELEEAPDDIPELVAEILTGAVARRLRRNLNTDYQRRQHDLNRVRGRINLLRTERRQLLQRARVACIFDELTVDTPRNRYIKAALLRLTSVVKTDLASRCRNLATRLERAGVQTEIDPNRLRHSITLNNLGWTDAEERQMLAAARLAFDLAIPTEESGAFLLPIVNRQETQGWKLYEDAVTGFYQAVLKERGWSVRPQTRVPWPFEKPTPGLSELMPGMARDLVLQNENQRIIIDTKFTSIVVTGQQGKETFKSGNIYQIYAYLRSQENDDYSLSLNSAGILLYPAICVDYDESAIIQGHQIRFATVNLAADSQTIRKQLLRIVNDGPTL